MSLQTINILIYPDNRLDVKNTAKYLGLTTKTLAAMRCRGTGPRFIKRGKVFYYKEDLDEWLQGCNRSYSTAACWVNNNPTAR